MSTLEAWATVGECVATGLLVIVAVAAAVVARRQIGLRKVDRVLELHNQFASGLVGASRMRFSNLMWKAGRCAFGKNPDGRWSCWKPSWESIFPQDKSIFPQDPARADDFNKNRFLGKYPEDIPGWNDSNPVADLRQVLWCIGRINGARERKEVDDALLINLLGWEVVWWYELCEQLCGNKESGGGVTGPLEALAKWILGQKEGTDLDYMKDRDYFPSQEFPPAVDFNERESKLRDNWKEDGTNSVTSEALRAFLAGLGGDS